MGFIVRALEVDVMQSFLQCRKEIPMLGMNFCMYDLYPKFKFQARGAISLLDLVPMLLCFISMARVRAML